MSLPLRLGALFLITLMAAGCATAPVVDRQKSARLWNLHLERLEQIGQWSFAGRVAVRSGSRAWSARLDWRQRHDRFEILITAPMGQGAARLDGVPGRVVLELPGEVPLQAPSPEALLEAYTGMAVPLGGMRFWLVGRPDPAAPATLEWDEGGRLARLEQGGWEVRYRRYEAVEGVDLPGRVDLWNEKVRVRVVIDGWSLPVRTGKEDERQAS